MLLTQHIQKYGPMTACSSGCHTSTLPVKMLTRKHAELTTALRVSWSTFCLLAHIPTNILMLTFSKRWQSELKKKKKKKKEAAFVNQSMDGCM